MRKKISNIISQKTNQTQTIFLAISVLIFSLLRLPSVIEPYWYGDEGIYEVIGLALRRGRILYEGIWDNKPPMLYLIYALFDGDQFYVRLFSLFFGIAAVIMFFALAKKLFKNNLAIYISTLFFAIVFGLPIIEGNIANAENFMLFPIIAGFYLALNGEEKKKNILLFFTGLLFSFAFLTKIVALFDFAALLTIIFILRFMDTISFDKRRLVKELRAAIFEIGRESILVIGFVVPIIITILYFLSVGALGDFFRASFSQNVGYVGYNNYFLFPMGLLFLKMGILLFSVLLIFRYRRSIGRTGVIVLTWLMFALFSSFFSERPYTHYLLMLLPAFSFFIAYVIEDRKMLKFTLPLILVIIILVNHNFSFYKKNIPYYLNYINFVRGGSVEKYQKFFDSNTPKDYEIANFINANTDSKSDDVFLWSDSSPIYAISGKIPPGRYIVAYHITFYKDAIAETKKVIESKKPKYIIQNKNDSAIDNFLDNYSLKYKIDNFKIYERQP
ncbi:MAG TPA: phospholipid carrier-dependent glycosyltransferase [Patescibacteria group bacterium]|nr:phospholipid carrier-dependent glycosyltransferase [Patescibacteria group bacterium]